MPTSKNYLTDFRFFLDRTDEKVILEKAIIGQLPPDKFQSVIDIGAGEGSISIPLSKRFSRYLAIEQNNLHADILRKNNIEVLEKPFPCKISERFDAVISCHSISHKPEVYKPFINSAVEILRPGGSFLLVDFRGRNDSWSSLMQKIDKPSVAEDEFHVNQIYSILLSRGETQWSIVKSKLLTKDLEDMVKSLSFVYSGGDRKRREYFLSKREIVVNVLKKRHWCDYGYMFIFEHKIINLKLK